MMPITQNQVVERLGDRPINELEYDVKERIYKVLREIIHQHDRNGFAKPLSLRKALKGVGDRWIYGALVYFERIGYIRIGRVNARGKRWQIKVTDGARKGLVVLHELLNPPKIDRITLNLNSIGKGCKVELSTDALENNEDTQTSSDILQLLIIPEVIHGAVEFMSALMASTVGELRNFTISIISNLPSTTRSPVLDLMHDMVSYSRTAIMHDIVSYLKMKNNTSREEYERRYGDISSDDVNEKFLYSRYLDLRLHPIMESLKERRVTCEELISQLGLPDSFQSKIAETRVRKWIIEQLNKDPNFFLPNLCWATLGFDVGEMCYDTIEVTPPSFEQLFTYPVLETKLDTVTAIFEGVISHQKMARIFDQTYPGRKREWSVTQEAFDYMHSAMLDVGYDPEFYVCWSILRRDSRYRGAILDIYRVFDSAYEKYILEGKKPVVDLARVFADLAHNRREMSEIVEEIRNDQYRIETAKKGICDPLLTEDEKELLTRYAGKLGH